MKKKKKNKNLKLISAVLGSLGVLCFVGLLVFSLFFEKKLIFESYEKKFKIAAESYLNDNKILFPKEGETREVTLEKLYSKNYVETLYIPKSDNFCENESWVRVYNNKGKYKYYTYLKCGNMESTTDHTGPVITLNGEKEITVDLGSEYKDLGVKSLFDETDGKMDSKLVEIDDSKVNTKKAGKYTVTYTVKDKLLNISKVERTVYVRQKLAEKIEQDVGQNKSYYGNATNNYLLYSGILWRILQVNSNGTIRIATQENMANMPFGKDNSVGYDDSNVVNWLNDYFYKFLISPETYLAGNVTTCIDTLVSVGNEYQCQKYSKPRNVATLSFVDVWAHQNNGLGFLNQLSYWLSDRTPEGKYWTKNTMDYIYQSDATALNAVRPVIHLKSDIYIIEGTGKPGDPYRIGDYKSGKENDYLKDRVTGEYINYSGVLWQIIDQDKDGNTKMVTSSTLSSKVNNIDQIRVLPYNLENKNFSNAFNPKEEGNVGEILNTDWINYISDKLLVMHEYEVSIYEVGQAYDKAKTNKVKAKIALPNMYEIFSSTNQVERPSTGKYRYINSSANDGNVLFINASNGMAFDEPSKIFNDFGVKLVAYVTKDAKIRSGKGTPANPYYIK